MYREAISFAGQALIRHQQLKTETDYALLHLHDLLGHCYESLSQNSDQSILLMLLHYINILLMLLLKIFIAIHVNNNKFHQVTTQSK